MRKLKGKKVTVRKCICLMITIVVILGMLSGCRGKDIVTTNKLAMGRYVESEIVFPDKIINQEQSLCKMETNEDGKLVVYGDGEDLEKYTYNGSGEWESEALHVGDKIAAECGDSYNISDIQRMENGDLYLGINRYSEVENKPILLKIDSNQSLTSIPIEGWDEYEQMNNYKSDPYKYYPTVLKLAVLSDGKLLIGDTKGVSLFDADGNKLRDYNEAVGNTIVVLNDNSFMTMNGAGNLVLTYEIESGERKNDVATTDSHTESNMVTPYDMSSSTVYQDKQGKIYLLNKDGVHSLADGGSIWETIIDGTLTSISRQDQSFKAFTKAGDQFYIISMGSSSSELLEYTYDENVASIPTNELSIYSLYNSATIRQAMVSFQQSHPDVKVNYRVAVGDKKSGTSNTSDYVKTLNTELLAGKGADIIVLDGLDKKTYSEKGILADISDIINPMEGNNELLSNIVDAYKEENGKIYSIPSRIFIPIAVGDKQDIANYGDMNKMTESINGQADASLLGSIVQSQLIHNLFIVKADSLMNEDNSINKEELNLFLQNLKIIYENSDIVSEKDAELINEYEKLYKKRAKVVYSNLASFSDFMFFCGVITEESIGYTTVNHLFEPSTELGINSVGQVDLSKEFIQEVLSEDIQKIDLGEGFPIHENSLNEWIKTESDIVGLMSFHEDDNTSIVEVKWPNAEERRNIGQLYKELTTPICVNHYVLDTIQKECNAFLGGDESAEEATENIIKGTKIYLSE